MFGRHKTAKIDKTVNSLIPVASYDDVLSCYKMKNGSYMNIHRVLCKDLSNLSEPDLERDFFEWTNFYRTFGYDMKLIAINVPENCHDQLAFIDKKLSRQKNQLWRDILAEERDTLEWLEKHREQKEYYIMSFANDVDSMHDINAKINESLCNYRKALEISKEEKHVVLTKLYNQMQRTYSPIKEADPEQIKKLGYDPYLITGIQPAGGVQLGNVDHVRTGRDYVSCIHIYEFPSETDEYWMRPLISLQNAIVTIDVSTEDENEVKKNINAGFKEQALRLATDRETGEILDAGDRYTEFQLLRKAVTNQGEIVKMIAIRVFVSAGSKSDLDKRVEEIIDNLTYGKGYKAAVFLNEQREEWLSLLMPFRDQQERYNHIAGQAMISAQLADGNPFHFSFLSDPTGIYMGSTKSSGSFKFNLFTHKPPTRISYNMFIAGSMGSGKSTTLKKLAKENAMFGNFNRIFDPSGEWMGISEEYAALYYDLASPTSRLNFFQIQRTGDDEQSCYARHVTNLTTTYTILKGDRDTADAFSRILTDFYREKGFLNEFGTVDPGRRVTGLPVGAYPTISDFIEYCHTVIDTYKQAADSVHRRLDERYLLNVDTIVQLWETVVQSYGYLLDGPSSIQNIADHPFVIFGLKQVFTLPVKYQAAIIFTALQLCWDNAVRNGLPQKELYDQGRLREEEIKYFLVEMDEFHHLVNSETKESINVLQTMMREMRKYFGGIVLATQNVTDITSEAGSSKEETLTSLVSKLMELSIYKFIGKQDASSLPAIRRLFGSIFSEQEMDRIVRLGQGEFLIALSTEQNLQVKMFLRENEAKIFGGGR